MTSLGLRVRRARRRRRIQDEHKLSRRAALQGLGALVGAATLSGCSDDEGAEAEADGGTSAESETGLETGMETETGGDGDGDGDGDVYEACEPSELTPAELLAGIDHIVVVMMENRSFDHYFGPLSLVEGLPVDGLVGTETNPDNSGDPIAVFNTSKWVHEDDPPHSWGASHAQFNAGANDGFVTEYQDRGAAEYGEVMSYYLREQLPVYYALADEYVLCDRWFSSVMSSTWPNRFYLHCADSDGVQTNDSISGVASIFDQLADAGISHRYYYSNLPVPLTYGALGNAEHIKLITEFFTDVDNGELPAFTIIDPLFAAGPLMGNDDHPPADVREGQAFIASIYDALAASPGWGRTLLVVTYDEHGGFFDHVPPPLTVDSHPGFEQLGFRVPSFVAGGQVRRSCVNGTIFDHVSVAATVAAKFGLEPLNDRVAATADLSSCIDPDLIDNPLPPTPLPRVVVPQTPKIYVPGANFGGQLELAALAARGRRDGERELIRTSQRSAEQLRDRLARRRLVRFG